MYEKTKKNYIFYCFLHSKVHLDAAGPFRRSQVHIDAAWVPPLAAWSQINTPIRTTPSYELESVRNTKHLFLNNQEP